MLKMGGGISKIRHHIFKMREGISHTRRRISEIGSGILKIRHRISKMAEGISHSRHPISKMGEGISKILHRIFEVQTDHIGDKQSKDMGYRPRQGSNGPEEGL